MRRVYMFNKVSACWSTSLSVLLPPHIWSLANRNWQVSYFRWNPLHCTSVLIRIKVHGLWVVQTRGWSQGGKSRAAESVGRTACCVQHLYLNGRQLSIFSGNNVLLHKLGRPWIRLDVRYFSSSSGIIDEIFQIGSESSQAWMSIPWLAGHSEKGACNWSGFGTSEYPNVSQTGSGTSELEELEKGKEVRAAIMRAYV